jgi:hypothetical protein
MSGGIPPPYIYALIARTEKTLLNSCRYYIKAYLALYFIIFNILMLNTKHVKFTLEQAIKAQKEICIPYSFFNLGYTRGWVVNYTSRLFYTWERDPVRTVIGGWVGAPEPVWAGAENLAPPEFDPWTVQPVVSLHTVHTDYAIPAPKLNITPNKYNPTNSINGNRIHKPRNFITHYHTHL